MNTPEEMKERWESGGRRQYEAYMRLVDFALSDKEEYAMSKADANAIIEMVDRFYSKIDANIERERVLAVALLDATTMKKE